MTEGSWVIGNISRVAESNNSLNVADEPLLGDASKDDYIQIVLKLSD